MFDRITMILTIVGGINWGLFGFLQFDLVAWICGGSSAILARIIYAVIGVAAVWCISFLFREQEFFSSKKMQS